MDAGISWPSSDMGSRVEPHGFTTGEAVIIANSGGSLPEGFLESQVDYLYGLDTNALRRHILRLRLKTCPTEAAWRVRTRGEVEVTEAARRA